jgi:hypothetical protein
MGDQEGDDEQVAQRMDALLRRLAKTPPQSRAELAEQVRRAKAKKRLINVRGASQKSRAKRS